MAGWVFCSVAANVAITATEYLNRTQGFASYPHALSVTFPLILVAQWGLFYSWRDAPSMMLAWAVFAVGSTTMRLVSVTWAVGEVPSALTLLGVAVMLTGAYMVKAG